MSNPELDKSLTQQLVCASIQTYRAFNAGAAFPENPQQYIGSPQGLTYVDFFEGQDVFDGNPVHKLVVFGLIFSVDSQPGRYVFAFRGTKGIAEWIDDLKAAKTRFVPLHPNTTHPLPDAARVEDGFWEIYQSMQKTVFEKTTSLAVKELVITGHSLGSALAELFTLDVALSSEIPFTSCNFACPRTGNEDWATFYDGLTKSVGNPTIRVVNRKDMVPNLPPELLGYQHVGEAYDICFKSEDKQILPDYGLRHSADNYARTLANDFGTSVTCQLESATLDDLDFC